MKSHRGLLKLAAALVSLAVLLACGGGSSVQEPPPAPKAQVTPLSDMGQQTYLEFSGGLYAGGSNVIPAAHDAAGRQFAARVTPLDAAGNPNSSGKIVLLAIGMSNTSDEWCGVPASNQPGGACRTPTNNSFMQQAAADPRVNHTTLAILDGAFGGQTAPNWDSPTDPDYDAVRDNVLTPSGVTERQVQVVWLKQANSNPHVSLPASNGDAYTLEAQLASIARAAKIRYPNLQMTFLSSRIYAGYATTTLNPEPYAFETGFAVKWVIQAQIDQMAAGMVTDARAADLNFSSVAPWLAWGPYPWADGATPRSDGLIWVPTDFNSDGTHPSPAGIQKVGAMLLNFFLNSPYTGWFRVSSP
jgi:hypothetical protein